MTETLRRFVAQNRRLLVVLLVVLVGDVGFYLLQSPLWLRARSLDAQVRASETELAAGLKDYGRARLEALLIEGAERRIDELFVGTFQSDHVRYPTVDAKIKELAEKFRFAPHSIAYGYMPLKEEGLEQLQVSFVLKGNYENLRQFLVEIEQARDEQSRDLFFTIERITLNDSTESGSELNLTVAMTTYFHKPQLAEEYEAQRGRGASGRGRSGGRT